MLKLVDRFTWFRDTNIVSINPGVRMLETYMISNDFKVLVSARLVRDITYFKKGQEILVEAGKNILVDLDQMLAEIDGDFTTVSEDEIFVYMN